MKRILVIIGLPGCGKDTVALIMKEKGIPSHGLGNIVRREVRKRGLPITKENQEDVAADMRKRDGAHAPAKILMQEIDKDAHHTICVNGPRSLEEIDHMAEHGDVILIEVEASEEKRFERSRKRDSEWDPKTLEDLRFRAQSNMNKLGMKHVMETKKYPRHKVNNDGTYKQLRKQVTEVLEKIGV